MKRSLQTLALAASLLAAPFAQATTPGTVEPTTTAEAAAASLTVASYRTATANSLRVFVQKTTDAMAWVRIKNAAGEELFEKGIAKHATGKAFKFDLADLPAGQYTIEVSNRDKKDVKTVELKTPAPVRQVAMH